MFLCGAKVMGGGSGMDLRTFYFLTNGDMTVSGLFTLQRNGIKIIVYVNDTSIGTKPRELRSDMSWTKVENKEN